jgi:predicted transcriptional regulator
MNYRDNTDTSATILQVANGGVSKSKIISIAFLNRSSSLQYFRMLLKDKLLVYQEEKRIFKTTPTGIKFLQLYHLMKELVNENNNLSRIQGATRPCWI